MAGRSRVRCSAVRYGHAWRGFRGEAGRGVVQPGLVSYGMVRQGFYGGARSR